MLMYAALVLRVCIDARNLPAAMANGTSVYAVELLKHLPGPVEASVLVNGSKLRGAFERLGFQAVETLPAHCQVFHRPSQFYHPEALDLFLRSPALPVITFLDLIAYRAPALFASFDDYRQYRALSFASLHSAQALLAISEHGRREIIDEFHLPSERVHAIHLGVDASFFGKQDRQRNLEVLRRRGIAGPYFFCSGSDYPHKNLGLLLKAYAWLRSLWKGPGPVPRL